MAENQTKTIVIKSLSGNHDFVCFEEVKPRMLKLLSGSFESKSEFRAAHPGNYLFVTFQNWLDAQEQ